MHAYVENKFEEFLYISIDFDKEYMSLFIRIGSSIKVIRWT